MVRLKQCHRLELVFHTVAFPAPFDTVGYFCRLLLSQTNKHYVDLSMPADLKCFQSLHSYILITVK